MDFLDGLLKDGGCNVDGTSSSINPVSALMSNLFETNHQGDDSLLMGQQDMSGMNMMAQAQTGQSSVDGGGFTGGMDGGESLLGSLTNMMIGNTDPNMNMQGMGMHGQQMGGSGMMGGMGGMGGMMQSMQMMAMAEQMQGMHGMHQQQHQHMLHEIQQLRSQMREMKEGQHDSRVKAEGYKDEYNGDIPLDEFGDPMMRGARENAEIYDNMHSVYGDPLDQDYGGPSKEAQAQGWEDLKERLENMGKDIEDSYVFETQNPYLHSNGTTNKVHTGLIGGDEHNAADVLQQEVEQEQDYEDSELFQKGLRFFNKGYISKAILAFEAEVQQHSGNDEAWRYLGLAHAENDEDKKAIVCLKKSLEVDPYNLNSLLALGTSYVNELDSQNALDALKAWVTHNPRFVGLDVTDDEYSDGTLMDEVMQLVLAAHSHAPDDIEVKILLGVMYNVSANYSEACQLFQDAVLLEESTSGARISMEKDTGTNTIPATGMEYSLYNKVGASLANNNKSDEALAYYGRALSHRPTYARAWLNLGISFANLNRYEESAKAYLQALHLSPTANHIWSYLKVVFTCLDKFDDVELCASGDIHTLAARLNMTFQPASAQEEVSLNSTVESQQEIEALPKSVAGVDVTFLGTLTQKLLVSTPDS